MNPSTGCLWVRAVGLPLPASQRTSLPPSCPALLMMTTRPRRPSSAAKPCSCRFGFRCAILGFGRCVFRERAMSHSACSSAWTRGNPGNSAWLCRTPAGLDGAWWAWAGLDDGGGSGWRGKHLVYIFLKYFYFISNTKFLKSGNKMSIKS